MTLRLSADARIASGAAMGAAMAPANGAQAKKTVAATMMADLFMMAFLFF
jgi:hypothetical protein